MLVRCITNDFNKLENMDVRRRLAESIHLDCADRNLVVDKTYAVYALAYWSDGGVRVYLHTIEENDFPYPYPLEMFTVIDSKWPETWTVNCSERSFMKGIKWISFPEWANDNYFYEKLVEGDKKTINLYKKLRVKGVGEKS